MSTRLLFCLLVFEFKKILFLKANLNRLWKLKLTCSNPFTLSKLDILGAHHNEVLITAKERISQEQVKLKELTERVTDQVHACSGNCLEDCLEAPALLEAQDLLKQHQMASHPGFVIAFDNYNTTMCITYSHRVLLTYIRKMNNIK